MVKKNLGIDGPIYVAPNVNVYAEKPKEPETNTGIMGLVRAIGRDLIGADPDKYMYSEGLSLAPVKKDIETGKIQPSFPGVFRSAAQEVKRVGALPGKAVRGEEVSPQEATDFALTFTGASVLAPKPSGVVATMGIGKAPQPQKIKPEKTKFGTYSKLEESILNLPQDKYQAKDVLSKLQKTEGVKEDELKWTGIGNLLEGKDKVTKQELVDHIQQNRVNIAEMPLGVMDRSIQNPGLFSVARVSTNLEKRKESSLSKELKELDVARTQARIDAEIQRGDTSPFTKSSILRSKIDRLINSIALKQRELEDLRKSQVYNGSVIGERSEKGLVNTMNEIEKSVDELIKPQVLRDTIDEGKGFEFALEAAAGKENPIASISPTAGIRNQNSIKKDTYWAVGSPDYGYKIMRNNELAFDANKGVTSDAFKKDFDRVFGEKLASDGFPLMEVSSLNNKYLKLDEPRMQTVINNLNGKANMVGKVQYPQYTLPPQKIEKENPFGRKYMADIMIKDPEANYREIPVGFDDATLAKVQQKQRELGEGVGKLETATTQGQTRSHYGMNEIGFYNVQDRNLPGFGKTFSVEHLQSDYGAAKGKLKQAAKGIYLDKESVRLATQPRYTDEQLAKLIPKEMVKGIKVPENYGSFYVATPYDYLKQAADGNHFDFLISRYDDRTIIPPLDEILKVLNPMQRRRYEAMTKRLDDTLDKIDFASAKKGKVVGADRIKQYDEGLITAGEAMNVLVPSAPITTKEPDVIKLLIRTALQRAAREDYDAISFPSGEVISTMQAINPGQKGITIYDKILPKEINKIMKKIGGKKYDDDNYFTKKEFYSSDKDPTSPDMYNQQRYSSSDPAEVVIDTDMLPEDNFLRVIPLSKEIKKKLLEEGAETFKEGGSIIASNPYGNYEPRAI